MIAETTERLRILVVDDDADSTELYQFLLGQRGMDVTVADTARSALELVRTTAFDLVMTDLNLSDGDGCDLFEAIRTVQDIPGIAATGMSGGDVERRCRAAGFAERILKPIDMDHLVASVHRLVRANAAPPSDE